LFASAVGSRLSGELVVDRYEAIQSVAASVKTGAGVNEVVRQAVAVCAEVVPQARWDEFANLDWRLDARQARDWLGSLLRNEPSEPTITGFWFGLFNPIVNGQPTSDFYIAGSTHYPSDDWISDHDWEPTGRYAHSPAQAEMHRLAATEGSEVLAVVDYVLTFAHAAATVNDLIAETESHLLLGGAQRRGIAVGHDSGDALFLGELTARGFDRSASDWI
jgi:hypothetical protein